MTDTYGSEPHDNDTSATPEEAQLPSEDEFISNEANSTEEQGVVPTRRSPVLPIIAAVGGVFLLGTVAWWQFGGDSSVKGLGASNSLLLPSAAMVDLSTPVPSATPPDLTQITPKTGLAEAPKESDLVAPPPPPSSNALSAVPVEPAQLGQGAPVASTVLPPPAFPMTATGAPPASGPVNLGSIESLSGRIDSLQKTVDTIASSTPGIGNASTPSTRELLDRIDKLEQKIATLNRSASGHASAGTDAVSEPRSRPTASKYKAVSKTAHKKAKSESVASGNKLVLRAVSNGQAWVSNGVDSSDLKQVKVGDKLPGIGRVTEIKSQGDKWVVQGTKGSLQ